MGEVGGLTWFLSVIVSLIFMDWTSSHSWNEPEKCTPCCLLSDSVEHQSGNISMKQSYLQLSSAKKKGRLLLLKQSMSGSCPEVIRKLAQCHVTKEFSLRMFNAV